MSLAWKNHAVAVSMPFPTGKLGLALVGSIAASEAALDLDLRYGIFSGPKLDRRKRKRVLRKARVSARRRWLRANG